MLEEFREAGVTFYDGWLVVKVVDHRNPTSTSATAVNGTDDDKPFSVHNYNPYITPSPHAPYPTKEQTGQKTSPLKHEKDTQGSDKNVDTVESTSSKPKPKVYHVGLRPTQLSRHQDMVLDALAPDPKSLNRKQSQANVNGRAGGVPQTPTSAVPPTPLTEKGPPLKKQKMKIDAKDLLDYESRVVNAIAAPLYLDPVNSQAEADALLEMLKDPFHDHSPPSPKSRKRTVAELAADDAHAKEQERFMLIMDERNVGTTGGANAAGVDGQAATAIFQPRFEKFNALESIKREMAEKEQREKARQLQEDENRREVQSRQVEEDRRKLALRAREQQAARLRQQQQEAHNLALQQSAASQQALQAQQQAQAARQQQQQQAQQAQASGIPPQVQNQVMGNQQRSSPIIRQGTPHAASSPVVNQGGAGSPARPGSAMQHSHPMARGPSNSGQSRHGTPQLPNATPGMRNATPVLRQGTPAQHMTQASPHSSMMAPTPQMAQANAAMGNHMPNGMNAQQIEMQRRQAALRMQQMQNSQQAGAMMNGNPQMQHQMAQQMAMVQRQNAMLQQQQQQQQGMHQQNPQMGQSPAQAQGQYNKQLSEQMKAQMQGLQSGGQGSPVQNQMTQQQAAAVAHQQQQQQRMMQQGQMMGMQGNGGQQQGQRPQNSVQAYYQQAVTRYQQQLMGNLTQRYGGNPQNIPPSEIQKMQNMAQQAARSETQARQQKAAQMAAQRQQQAHQQGMVNGMNMNMMNPNMAAMQQQQQAQQMQGMQLAHAQQMLAQQQQQQQGNMYQQMQMQQQQQRQG